MTTIEIVTQRLQSLQKSSHLDDNNSHKYRQQIPANRDNTRSICRESSGK